jgi:uncharacterized protein (DUF1015 family)
VPKVIPFKAIRPTRDKVSLVTSMSYDTYAPEARDARMAVNPYTFLHIINPGFKFHKEISGQERYQLVKNRYLEFKEDKVFKQEEKPCFYIYKKINRDNEEFVGIFAGVATADYDSDIIKKHEDTLHHKETLFKEYLKTVGFNAEPVLLTFEDHPDISKILKKVTKKRPEYEFTTTYKDTHYLWVVEKESVVSKIAAIFNNIESLYIADGHHRSASSALLAKDLKSENPNHTGNEAYNFFMGFLIPESHLKIYEFNRLIKDLNGLSKEEFLIQLDTHFIIENLGNQYIPVKEKHQFVMYLDGEFYQLILRKNTYSITNALEALDTHILHHTILEPILGIHDVRNCNRLNYVDGKQDFVTITKLVDSGEYAVCFGMLPITINELKEVANQGLKMPPKSTYIQPKLLSGLTIYEF